MLDGPAVLEDETGARANAFLGCERQGRRGEGAR